MTDSEAYKLAQLYFSGTISREDEMSLYAYIRQDDTTLALFRQWEEEWEAVHDDAATDEAWARLSKTIHADSGESGISVTTPPTAKARTYSLFKYAASIAAAVVITFGISFFVLKAVNNKPVEYYSLSAPMGSKSRFVMTDGTVVWLNAGSTLRYSNRYGDDNRKVELDGEAYFEVKHHDDKEFTVATKGYNVIVKGTHFDVSAYSDDQNITTTLMQGHVVIERGGTTLDMKPGDQVSFNKRSGKFNTTHMTDDVSAWKSDVVDYTSITLESLARKLSRQYDVNIEIRGHKLQQTCISITLYNELTIDEVIGALQTVTGAKVSRQGKHIVMI